MYKTTLQNRIIYFNILPNISLNTKEKAGRFLFSLNLSSVRIELEKESGYLIFLSHLSVSKFQLCADDSLIIGLEGDDKCELLILKFQRDGGTDSYFNKTPFPYQIDYKSNAEHNFIYNTSVTLSYVYYKDLQPSANCRNYIVFHFKFASVSVEVCLNLVRGR